MEGLEILESNEALSFDFRSFLKCLNNYDFSVI